MKQAISVLSTLRHLIACKGKGQTRTRSMLEHMAFRPVFADISLWTVSPLEPALPPRSKGSPGRVQPLAHWQDVPPVAPIPRFSRTFSLFYGAETGETDAVPRLGAFVRTSPGLSCRPTPISNVHIHTPGWRAG